MADSYNSNSKKRRTAAAPPVSIISIPSQYETYLDAPPSKRAKGRLSGAMSINIEGNVLTGGMPAPPPVDRPKMVPIPSKSSNNSFRPAMLPAKSKPSPATPKSSTGSPPSPSKQHPAALVRSNSDEIRFNPFSTRLANAKVVPSPPTSNLTAQTSKMQVDPTLPVPPSAPVSEPPAPSHSNSSPPILKQANRWPPASAGTPTRTPPANSSSPAADAPFRRSTSAPSGNTASIIYYKVEIPETSDLNGPCPLQEEATSGDVPSWGLPMIVVQLFQNNGLKQIHDWQRECLKNTGVVGGKSLVYSLPTSGGKTYVAEILLMRTVFEHRKIAIFVLPYVAIVTEKVKSLKEFGKALNFSVEGFYLNNGRLPLPKQIPTLCVCTIEKANLIVNTLIEEGRIKDLGLVVFDEMHMLCQPNRGYLLEILGTKVKYASDNSVQMVGMSATLPNLSTLGAWLNAGCYYRNFRPVALVEHVFDDYDLLTTELKPLQQTQLSNGTRSPPPSKPSDRNYTHHYVAKRLGRISSSLHIDRARPASGTQKWWDPLAFEGAFQLARELMPFSGTLIFCSSRAMASKLALSLATRLESEPLSRTGYAAWIDWEAGSEQSSIRVGADRPNLDPKEWAQKMAMLKEERELLVKQLRATSPSKVPNEDLVTCLRHGVAWHTAEHGNAEREMIERAFRMKIISIICCTSTLAAGVNMPARRVVLMSSKMGYNELTVGEYRQMVGRAGRAGIDAIGESFLFIAPPLRSVPENMRNASNHKAIRLLVTPLEAIQSTLAKTSNPSESEWYVLRASRKSLYRRSKSPNSEIATFPASLPFDKHVIMTPSLSEEMEYPPVSYFFFTYKNSSKIGSNGKSSLPMPMEPSGCGIDRLILDAIAGRSAVTEREIFKYLKCTFLASQKQDEAIHDLIKKSLQFMTAVHLVEFVDAARATRMQSNEADAEVGDVNHVRIKAQHRDYMAAAKNENGKEDLVLVTTQFGSAAYRTSLSIESVLYLREELERAMDALTLRSELHMCWLSIPVMQRTKPRDSDMEPWKRIVSRCIMAYQLSKPALSSVDRDTDSEEEKLPIPSFSVPFTDRERVQGAFACRMGVIVDSLGAKSGGLPVPAAQPSERFVLTLLLQDIVEEMKLSEVAQKYHLSVGDLESLMQTAGTQAGQLAAFCRSMGWATLEALFKLFCGRVSAGAKDDILPLMKIKGVKVGRARVLYNADFKTIRAVAHAQDYEIAQALSNGNAAAASIATRLAKSIITSAKDLLAQTVNEMRIQASRLEDPTPTPEQGSTPPTAANVSKRLTRSSSSKSKLKSASSVSKLPSRSNSIRDFGDKEVDESLALIDHSFYDSLYGDDLLLLDELDEFKPS